MYLVNNRYRIINSIKHSNMISSFAATDIIYNNRLVNLNILDPRYISKEYIEKAIEHFSFIKNISSSDIIKLFDFEAITSIDNNRYTESKQFYYTNELFEPDGDFSVLLSTFSEQQAMDFFVRICQNISYIHHVGLVYKELIPENILISLKNNSFKLKDYVTFSLENIDYWDTTPKTTYFQAPELLEEVVPKASSDIYSLGVLLITLLLRTQPKEMNVPKEVEKLKLENNRLQPIIEKMVAVEAADRYQSISELFIDLNDTLGSNYRPYINEDLDKIFIDIKFVGRKFEVDTIMSAFKFVQNDSEESKLVLVHGEAGVGKSRLLMRLKHIISFEKGDVFYNLTKSTNVKSNPINDALRQYISFCDKEILSKYENELVKFVPEIGGNGLVVPSEPLSGDLEKYRLMNRIFSFFSECTKGKTTTFIIDDIHLMDDFTIECFKYILERKIKNVLFILSFSDTEHKSDMLNTFIRNFREQEDTIDIGIREFNLDETNEQIKYILYRNKVKDKFCRKIYNKTFGNPKFTEEVIKNLVAEKILYLDDDAVWDTDYNIDNIPMPQDMEQAVLSQVKDMDESSRKILNLIAVFNAPISIFILDAMILTSIDELSSEVDMLLNRGVLVRKIEDRGYTYDFSNTLLKSTLYSKLTDDYKHETHSKLAEILEHNYTTGKVNREELIYHLEKSGQQDKVVEHCLANADLMENFKNRTEVIKNLLKAFSVLDKVKYSKQKLETTIRLAGMYFEEGRYNDSMYYFSYAEKLSSNGRDFEIHIKILNKICNICYLINEYDNGMAYIELLEKIFKHMTKENIEQNTEAYLEFIKNKISFLLYHGDYTQNNLMDESFKLINPALELCGNKYLKEKGELYNIIGNLYFDRSESVAAMYAYKEALYYSQEANYQKGINANLNSIGVIYGDFYQDYKNAIEYYLKGKKLNEASKNIVMETLSLINLGDAHYYLIDYKKAYDYLKEALDKAKIVDYQLHEYYCHTYLMRLCAKLGYYQEAWDICNENNKLISTFSTREKDNDIFYQNTAEMYYEFGDIEKTKEYLAKAMEAYGDIETKPATDCRMLNEFINIYTEQGSLEENFMSLENIISKNQFFISKLDAYTDLVILLLEIDNKFFANHYFELSEKIICEELPPRLKAKRLYVKAMLNKGEEMLKYLMEALVISKEENMLELSWKINFNIGEYYLTSNKYFSVNYHFDACEIIKQIMLNIPEGFKLSYLNTKKALKPFARLYEMKKNGELTIPKTEEEIYDLLDLNHFDEILNNQELKQSARKIYDFFAKQNIESDQDLLQYLSKNTEEDFVLICRYLSRLTIATKALIIIDSQESDLLVFSSSQDKNINSDIKHMLDRVRSERNTVLITSLDKLSSNQKATICIPIISSRKIIGYIYLESDKILNDFNKENLSKCVKIGKLVSILIEKFQLKKISTIDRLTGTMTRKAMEEALENIVNVSGYEHREFSIIMLDLDFFKSINDKFGHQTGDRVLKEISAQILSNLEGVGTCGRYGGEEFLILLPNMASSEAMSFANELRESVEKSKFLGDRKPVTVSMGVATYPMHGTMYNELVDKADQALYVAKEAGRNRCQLWEEGFSKEAKVANKLTGILTGNSVQEYRNISVMIEIIELIKLQESLEKKIYKFLGRIIEITEAQNGSLYLIRDKGITKKYSRKQYSIEWQQDIVIEEALLDEIFESKKGFCTINWEETDNYDPITGLPEWTSKMLLPLEYSGEIIGVLYLSVPLKQKEFNSNEYNFIENLAQIFTGVI